MYTFQMSIINELPVEFQGSFEVHCGRTAETMRGSGRGDWVLPACLEISCCPISILESFHSRVSLGPKRAPKPLLTVEKGNLQKEVMLAAILATILAKLAFSLLWRGTLGGSEPAQTVWYYVKKDVKTGFDLVTKAVAA